MDTFIDDIIVMMSHNVSGIIALVLHTYTWNVHVGMMVVDHFIVAMIK